jgi:acyl dehydratase
MKFTDFHAGQIISAGPLVLSEHDIVRFASEHDPQHFHMDPAAAAAGKFGSVIASGWHTCAVAMRLVAQAALQGSGASASPGIAYIKWPRPVLPGDALSLRAEVLEVGRSERRPSLGELRQLLAWLELEAMTLFDLPAP